MIENILSFVLEHLISLVISGIGVYITYTVVPWLKKLVFFPIVRIFVKGAEKLGETSQIDKTKKKEYVIEGLESIGIKVTPLIDAMIEAAVKELDEQVELIFQNIKQNLMQPPVNLLVLLLSFVGLLMVLVKISV